MEGRKMKYKYEIRQIDAWAEYEDQFSWSWNESYHIGEFETAAQDHKRAFLRALHRAGIAFYPGRVKTEYDGSIYEVVDRKTGEPLFAALPMNF